MKRTTRGQFVVAAVFGHVGAGEDAERRADQHRDRGHDQAADDRVEQAAGRAGRRRHFGEHRERQAAEAFPQQHARISTSQERPNAVARIGEAHGDGVAAAAAGVERGVDAPWSDPRPVR